MLSYTWEVISVKKDVAGLKMAYPALSQSSAILSAGDIKTAQLKFFRASQNNLKVLKVPRASLINFYVYTLKVTVHARSGETLVGTTSSTVDVVVRSIPNPRSFEALGVLPDKVRVDGRLDLKNTIYYSASYNLCLSPVIMEDTDPLLDWVFSVDIFTSSEDLVTLTSTKCSDSWDYYLPYSAKTTYTVTVVFNAKFGETEYQTIRKIAVGSSTSNLYKMRKLIASPLFKKADSTTTPAERKAPFDGFIFDKILGIATNVQLLLSDLASAASTVNAFLQNAKTTHSQQCENNGFTNNPDFTATGSCNNDANVKQCCGLGACTTGVISTFRCICIDQQTGIFCNVPKSAMEVANYWIRKILDKLTFPVTPANVFSNLQILNVLARTETPDLDILNKILIKLFYFSDYIQDGNGLQDVLAVVNRVSQNMLSFSKDNSNVKETYVNLQLFSNQVVVKALQNSVRSVAPSNPHVAVSASEVQGHNVYVDVNKLSSTLSGLVPNVKNSQVKYTFTKDVFKTASTAVVQALLSNRGSSSLAKGAPTLASENLEINVYNQATFELIDTSFLDGDCPVQITLEAQPSSNAAQSSFQCLFFDPSDNVYKQDGCRFVEASQLAHNGNFAVTCCCRHMTKFAVGYSNTLVKSEVKAEESSSEEFADWKIAIIIVIPIGFLIICLILYVVLRKKPQQNEENKQ